MKFSNGKVKAFYGADQTLRESIRQDVLVERYADLQEEMAHLEDLLDISDKEIDEPLFDINDMLFDIIETIVPELTMTDDGDEEEDVENIDEAPPAAGGAAAKIKDRATKIKQRERKAIALARNKEKLVRAKSNIKSAALGLKGADSPEAKSKARERLRSARGYLSKAGIKAGTAKK